MIFILHQNEGKLYLLFSSYIHKLTAGPGILVGGIEFLLP